MASWPDQYHLSKEIGRQPNLKKLYRLLPLSCKSPWMFDGFWGQAMFYWAVVNRYSN
jgi:hypothetical protein